MRPKIKYGLQSNTKPETSSPTDRHCSKEMRSTFLNDIHNRNIAELC